MRFYGIPSEDRALEIVKSIDRGEWIYEDTKEKTRLELDHEEVKEKLKNLVEEVKRWKEELSTLTQGTVFIFVCEPQEPKAFKIYDTSSLGCSTSLTPPRWKVYLKELEKSL